jgi:hypothetical protein
MTTNFKSLIEKEVDRLFGEPDAANINPITGMVNWGNEPIGPQKRAAILPLLAREWFAVYGPPDAPRLPLSDDDVDDYRKARGLAAIVGFFARSLSRQGYGRQSYDVCNHPSFDDFACGLMARAMESGLWDLEKDEQLKRRFPPRPLAGMTPGAYWAPPKEYEETMASYNEVHRPAAKRRSN